MVICEIPPHSLYKGIIRTLCFLTRKKKCPIPSCLYSSTITTVTLSSFTFDCKPLFCKNNKTKKQIQLHVLANGGGD